MPVCCSFPWMMKDEVLLVSRAACEIPQGKTRIFHFTSCIQWSILKNSVERSEKTEGKKHANLI